VRLEFSFPVGVAEQHIVHFSFDQVWGSPSIKVDEKPVIRDWRFIEFSLTKEYRFTVGMNERPEMVIVTERPLVLAGFRRQKCRVIVDGQMAGEYSSYR